MLPGFRAAQSAADARTLERALHKLRGALLNCGLSDLAGEAATLELAVTEPARPSLAPRVAALHTALAGMVHG